MNRIFTTFLILCLVLFQFIPVAHTQGSAGIIIQELKVRKVVIFLGSPLGFSEGMPQGRTGLAQIEAQVNLPTKDNFLVRLPIRAVTGSIQILEGNRLIEDYTIRTKSPNQGESYANSILLSWRRPEGAGASATIKFLMGGVSWFPLYRLDLLSDEEGLFLYSVVISDSPISIQDSDLFLTTTRAQEAYETPNAPPMAQSAIYGGEMAEAADLYIEPSRPVSIETLNIRQLIKMKEREIYQDGFRNLAIYYGKVALKKRYLWYVSNENETGNLVNLTYEMKNPSEYLMTSAPVNVYNKDHYIGSDAIEPTPKGALGLITLGAEPTLQCRRNLKTEVFEKPKTDDRRYTVSISVKSLSDEPITVEIFDRKNENAFEFDFKVKPEITAENRIKWVITVKPKGSFEITYTYFRRY